MGQFMISTLLLVYLSIVQSAVPLNVANISETGIESRSLGTLGVLSTLLSDAGVKPCKPCGTATHNQRPKPHPPPHPAPSYQHYEPPKRTPSDEYQPIDSAIYLQPVKPVKPHHPPESHSPNVDGSDCIKKPSCPYRPAKDDFIDYEKPGIEVPYQPPSPPHNKPAPTREVYPEEEGCICVPYYQCVNGKIIDDGSGIIDPRIKEPPKKEIPLDEQYKPPYCGTFHVCCIDPQAQTKNPYTHKCGIRNPSGINRRILVPSHKGESDFGEWPWQAAVLKVEKDMHVFQCGGTLIDSLHVLTVAHCVKPHVTESGSCDLIIRLGEWDTQKTTEFLPHDDYQVAAVFIHPKFNPNNLWNDIAVVKLSRPVTFKPNIDTICLPTPNEIFDGQQCVTTGWGKNAYMGGQFSNILKEVSVPVIPNHECQRTLRRTRLGGRFRLHDSFMCAGGEEGRDSCKGDGGGPLVCYRPDGTYTLAGIVSWGIDCGKSAHPGVYVKIQKFLDWITEKTGNDVKNYWSPASNYPTSST